MEIFKLVDIVPEHKCMDGDKVKIEEILNKPIIILGVAINNSKYAKDGDKCLTVQFYLKDDPEMKHKVLFSGSKVLIAVAEKLLEKKNSSENDFAVETMICKVGKSYQFC